MAHERIRPFDTKGTCPEQRLDGDPCRIVVTRGGRTVRVRGRCPEPDGATHIESHDPAVRTHEVMRNIRRPIGGALP